MYNNYPNSGYQSAYPQYQQSYGSGYSYQGYAQYPNQTTQPILPGEGTVTSTEWGSATYTPTQKDAVAQEMQQQKAQLTKQREDYVRKASVLRHELEQLRIQKQELVGNGRSPDRELANILRQNDKLQEEIQGKMKAIHNVIEMLSSIIKDGQSIADLEASLMKAEAPQQTPPIDQSRSYSRSELTAQLRQQSEAPESPKDSMEKSCYVHYDTGLHWCRSCDEFPETAKDFLLHLQDKKHKEAAKENDHDSTPWHKLPAEPVLPSHEGAPVKRIPIKGLQFFISAPSWYCKLCDVWIGDLHCASHHLKSQAHFQNYENFIAQNPHWEMEWLKDREKSKTRQVAAQEDSSESDSSKRKRKRKEKRQSQEMFGTKDKKKKKKTKKKRRRSSDSSSSSSSSDSTSDDENEDRSKSIRVAMRNMKQVQSIMEEDLSAKWSVLEKLVDEHKKKEVRDSEKRDIPSPPPPPMPEDPLINQWMTVSQPPAKEKQMLEELKDRMRQKQENERIRQAELEQRRKEKEREEREKAERRKREEREAAEMAEKEKRKREQEDMERIRDKERNQVRFKTNYRRRGSPSKSGDEEEQRHEKYYRQESTRHGRDSESRSNYKSHNSRSRSRSVERNNRKSSERSGDRKQEESNGKSKKPPGPPSYKKLPFIGRMPLFKNRVKASEEKEEIKKQSYDQPRRTRFEPGNLPRAFMPKPEVVCFPKLSSIPPLNIPPPPPVVTQPVLAPAPPKITYDTEKNETAVPKAPPPPKIESEPPKPVNLSDDEVLYGTEGVDPSTMGQYYQSYGGMMYQQQDMYHYENEEPIPPPPPPHPHGMPLEPPPLPPDDDLALLGICADDMAAQSF
nr:zinc finger matrin-type protein CG9776-like isoform X1 [Leptinotarsa decemlineata]